MYSRQAPGKGLATEPENDEVRGGAKYLVTGKIIHIDYHLLGTVQRYQRRRIRHGWSHRLTDNRQSTIDNRSGRDGVGLWTGWIGPGWEGTEQKASSALTKSFVPEGTSVSKPNKLSSKTCCNCGALFIASGHEA